VGAAVVAEVSPGPQDSRARPQVALTLDVALRPLVPVVEVLAADGGEEICEVLGRHRAAPAVAGTLEEPVRVAHVLELAAIVVASPGL
jgi:hypothetical protein